MPVNGKRKGSSMNIEIAQRLYELRRKHGFSQESLAAELVGETTDDAVVENIEIDDGSWVDDATNAEAERLATDGVDQAVLTSSANPTTASIPAAAPPPAPDVKQVSAHGHIYMRPPAQTAPRCKLRSFPYPLLVTVIFLVLALVFSLWEYVWLFLTIPFYYWIARIIERDPNFLAEHGYGSDNTAQQPIASSCAAEAKEAR